MLLCLPVTISGTQVGLAVALVGLLLGRLRGTPLPRTPLDEPILVLLGVTVVSALASRDPAHALARFAGGWTVCAFYLVAARLRDPARLERFLGLAVPPALAIAAYGIVQHFTGVDLLRGGGLHSLEFGGSTVYFPRGGFSHYQTFANVFFILFCLLLARAAAARRPAQRLRRGAAAALLGAAVVVSYTRGIWLALLAAVAVFCWAYARRAALAAAAAVALLVLAVLATPSALRTRALSMADRETNVERLLLWETTWNMVRDNPLLGVGVGNYLAAQESYVREEVPMAMTRTHAHNVLLQVAVERGVLGLLAFLWLAGAALCHGVGALGRLRPRGGLPFALEAGALAAVVGFLLDGFVQNNFGDSQAATVFWVAAGVLVVCVPAAVAPAGAGAAA